MGWNPVHTFEICWRPNRSFVAFALPAQVRQFDICTYRRNIALIASASDQQLYYRPLLPSSLCPSQSYRLALGTLLAQSFGLPVMQGCPLTIDHLALTAYDGEQALRSLDTKQDDITGLSFFGSKVTALQDSKTSQIFLPSHLPRIENRGALLGMLVLEIWINCVGRRSLIFSKTKGSSIALSFLPHQNMFCSDVSPPDPYLLPLNYDLRAYIGIWNDVIIQRWIELIQAIPEPELLQISSIPGARWSSQVEQHEVIDLLLNRRKHLDTLLQPAKAEVLKITEHSSMGRRSRAVSAPTSTSFRDWVN